MSDGKEDLGYRLAYSSLSDPKDGEPRPGLVLKDRFLLIKEIGKGGQSQVFKARDLIASRAGLAAPDVALKILRAGPEIETDFVKLMHREARRLRDLVHPNIVRVYDMDRQKDLHFMVMELMEGQTLSQILKTNEGRKLEFATVCRIVQDLGAALKHAHGHGVVHSDLKPGNVFVEDGGVVKLIDFNISAPIAPSLRADEEDTLQILIRIGAVTPAYASPQRLQGAEPCEADDVFSLAVLIYLCLSGTRPYGDKNALEALEADLQPARLDMISPAQWRTLSQALALRDSDRTGTIDNLMSAFQTRTALSPGEWLRSQLQWS